MRSKQIIKFIVFIIWRRVKSKHLLFICNATGSGMEFDRVASAALALLLLMLLVHFFRIGNLI